VLKVKAKKKRREGGSYAARFVYPKWARGVIYRLPRTSRRPRPTTRGSRLPDLAVGAERKDVDHTSR